MYEILEAKELADSIYKFVVKAPRCAASCEPGQFVIVRTHADSERIPLTVCDYNREEGTVTIVVQVIGASTFIMKTLKKGDFFHDFVYQNNQYCKVLLLFLYCFYIIEILK